MYNYTAFMHNYTLIYKGINKSVKEMVKRVGCDAMTVIEQFKDSCNVGGR